MSALNDGLEDGPAHYDIRILTHLDPHWSNWFDGMTIQHEADGETLLTGMVADQAALHGLLRKLRDLGLTLVAVTRSPGPIMDEEQTGTRGQ